MKLYQGKTYKIWWIDTISFSGWFDKSDIEQRMKYADKYVETIGYYVCQDKNFITLASSYNKYEDWGYLKLIPLGCIRKIKLII